MSDSNKLFLTMPIPPGINNDYIKPRGFVMWIKGKPTAKTTMYETKEAKQFKKQLTALVKQEVLNQSFRADYNKFTLIEWTWFFPQTNMDTNNFYKCVLDAITESKEIWIDDNTTINKDDRLYYDSKNPRLELAISYLPWVGIFDTIEEHDIFVQNNCAKCSKGKKIGQKGGCSVYKNARENRIKPEIVDGVCQKIKLKK